MSITSEEQWIAQAKIDAQAFGMLYRHYVERIYAYHYRHTSNHQDAEDLTSKTFHRALCSIRAYREQPGASFQAWLYRIAHNLVANWYRDNSRHPVTSIENALVLHSDAPSLEHDVEAHESRIALLDAISKLPEERKTLIILKFVNHLSNAEIAAVLGKTEGAIKALYHRTLLGLKKALPGGVWDDATS